MHLLEQSSLDLQEEPELTALREEVVTKIRSNQQLEKDLNLMDIKIGLLVKNRITLQVRARVSVFNTSLNGLVQSPKNMPLQSIIPLHQFQSFRLLSRCAWFA